MTSESEAKALDMLQGVAGKIGSTIETLWPEAVRYVAVEGAVTAIAAGVALLLVIGSAAWAWRAAEDLDDLSTRQMVRGGIFVLAAILVPAFLFGGVVPNVTQALAPQGYLVTKIVTGAGK